MGMLGMLGMLGSRLICHRTDLEADLALAALPLALVQADHEGLVALLPVQRHGLVALAEDLDLVLLHVRDDLREKKIYKIRIE